MYTYTHPVLGFNLKIKIKNTTVGIITHFDILRNIVYRNGIPVTGVFNFDRIRSYGALIETLQCLWDL